MDPLSSSRDGENDYSNYSPQETRKEIDQTMKELRGEMSAPSSSHSHVQKRRAATLLSQSPTFDQEATIPQDLEHESDDRSEKIRSSLSKVVALTKKVTANSQLAKKHAEEIFEMSKNEPGAIHVELVRAGGALKLQEAFWTNESVTANKRTRPLNLQPATYKDQALGIDQYAGYKSYGVMSKKTSKATKKIRGCDVDQVFPGDLYRNSLHEGVNVNDRYLQALAAKRKDREEGKEISEEDREILEKLDRQNERYQSTMQVLELIQKNHSLTPEKLEEIEERGLYHPEGLEEVKKEYAIDPQELENMEKANTPPPTAFLKQAYSPEQLANWFIGFLQSEGLTNEEMTSLSKIANQTLIAPYTIERHHAYQKKENNLESINHGLNSEINIITRGGLRVVQYSFNFTEGVVVEDENGDFKEKELLRDPVIVEVTDFTNNNPEIQETYILDNQRGSRNPFKKLLGH